MSRHLAFTLFGFVVGIFVVRALTGPSESTGPFVMGSLSMLLVLSINGLIRGGE